MLTILITFILAYGNWQQWSEYGDCKYPSIEIDFDKLPDKASIEKYYKDKLKKGEGNRNESKCMLGQWTRTRKCDKELCTQMFKNRTMIAKHIEEDTVECGCPRCNHNAYVERGWKWLSCMQWKAAGHCDQTHPKFQKMAINCGIHCEMCDTNDKWSYYNENSIKLEQHEHHSCGRDFTMLGRVIGGSDAKPGQFPWHVAIDQISESGALSRHCGGTIVNERFILTAAHCFVGKKLKNEQLRVQVGKHDMKADEKHSRIYKIAKIIIHDFYDPNTFDNDIALVMVSEQIEYGKFVQPVCFDLQPNEILQPSTECKVAGWGHIDPEYIADLPEKLQTVDIPLHDLNTCRSHYDNIGLYLDRKFIITDNMICGGYLEGGKDTCQGDSGGGLFCKIGGQYSLYGIVSFGEKCGQINRLGKYAKVPNYLEWIESNMVVKGLYL